MPCEHLIEGARIGVVACFELRESFRYGYDDEIRLLNGRSRSEIPKMSSSQPIAILEVTIPQPPESKFERERQAFYRMLPELLRTYQGRYVAVHNEQFADSGPDRLSVAQRVLEKVGPCDIYVGLVDLEPIRPSRFGVVSISRSPSASRQ
jgi:hypothetical protein